MFLFLHTQAQEYLVAVYIVGFVIGVTPLCVTVITHTAHAHIALAQNYKRLPHDRKLHCEQKLNMIASCGFLYE